MIRSVGAFLFWGVTVRHARCRRWRPRLTRCAPPTRLDSREVRRHSPRGTLAVAPAEAEQTARARPSRFVRFPRPLVTLGKNCRHPLALTRHLRRTSRGDGSCCPIPDPNPEISLRSSQPRGANASSARSSGGPDTGLSTAAEVTRASGPQGRVDVPSQDRDVVGGPTTISTLCRTRGWSPRLDWQW